MAENTCANCGVPLSETPEEDGFHHVQMVNRDENGDHYCTACFFGGSGAEDSEGEYDNTGKAIVVASDIDMEDEELAQALAENMKAEELRRWMSGNGLSRSRGARKMESAREAVQQDRTRVAYTLSRIANLETEEPHSVNCKCGYEEFFADKEDAVAAAEEHKSENPQHFPKAWGNGGEERLYG